MDEHKVWTLHRRWLRVANQDRYLAAVLKLHYRDHYEPGDCTFTEQALNEGLDLFSKQDG
jgi:hypothetical protein